MNKLIKKITLMVAVVVLLVLGTTCISDAIIDESKKAEKIKYFSGSNSYAGFIFFDELKNDAALLCAQKGGHLRARNSGKLSAFNLKWYANPGSTTEDTENTRYGLPSSSKPKIDGLKGTETPANYTRTGPIVANPWESYVLAQLQDYGGGTEFTPVQVAWWKSHGGSGVDTSNEDAGDLDGDVTTIEVTSGDALSLAEEATEFHNFINSISPDGHWKIDNTSTDIGGATVPRRFDVEYNPEWITEESSDDDTNGNLAKPTVMLDGSNIIIGPFAIKYDQKIFYNAKGERIELATITGMDIYTDKSTSPLASSAWEFVWLDKSKHTDYAYPFSGEKFFIKIKSYDGSYKITNMKTQFKYMNGCGEYDVLNGKYNKINWKLSYEKTGETEDDTSKPQNEDGSYPQKDVYGWYLRIDDTETGLDSQTLNYARLGALWYEYVLIDRELEYEEGSFTIEKIVEVGTKPISEFVDKQFTFETTVEGALNSGSEKIYVKSGEKGKSQPYYWLKGSSPKLTVKEIDVPAGYSFSRFVDADGNTSESNPITVTLKPGKNAIGIQAINKTEEHKAKITLKKFIDIDDVREVLENVSNPEAFYQYLKTRVFNFKVNITGKEFSYNNESYSSDKPLNINLTINGFTEIIEDGKIVGFEGSVETDYITWGIAEAPSYSVEEETQNGFQELVSENGKGTFSSTSESPEDYSVEIIADNELEKYKGNLKIIKRVNISQMIIDDLIGEIPNIETIVRDPNFKLEDYIDEDELKRQEFKFVEEIGRYIVGSSEPYEKTEGINIILKNGNIIKEGNDYIGEWTSTQDFEWLFGEEIHYKIEEPNTDEYELIGFVDKDGNNLGTTVSGVLKEGDNGTLKVEIIANNKLKFTPMFGGLKLTKKVVITDSEEEEDKELKEKQEKELYNKDYTFDVIIKGPFIYKDKFYSKGEYKITNTPATESGEFEREPSAVEGEIGKIKLLSDGEFRIVKKDEAKENDVIVIRIEENEKEKSITIDGIKWYNKFHNVPEYSVEEHLLSNEVLSEVHPTTGTISPDVNSNVHLVTAINTIPYYRGKIQVYKTVSNEEALTEEDLTRTFRVGITVNYHNSRQPDYGEFILERNSDKLEWTIKDIPVYTWFKGDPIPTYEVKEIEEENGFVFKSGENLTGFLTPNTEQDVELKLTEPPPILINEKLIGGGIKLSKIVLDDNGKELNINKEYTFDIKIGDDTYNATIKPGETWAPDKVYSWREDEEGPAFKIRETSATSEQNVSFLIDGVEVKETAEINGKLVKDKIINVICKNTSTEGGYIEITKTVVKNDGSATRTGDEFKVTGTVNGAPIVNEKDETLEKLKVGETWRSKMYPIGSTYSITEEEPLPEGYEFDSIHSDNPEDTANGSTITGTIPQNEADKDSTVSINIINKYKKLHSGTITIKKLVNGTYDENKTFSFSGTVGTEDLVDKKGNPPNALKVGETWTSKTYEWTGDAPEYEITEAEDSEYKFLRFEERNSLNGAIIDNNNRTIKGILNDGNTVNVIAYNEGKVKHYEGNLEITKEIRNTALRKQTFLFDVKIYSDKGTEFAFKNNPDEKYKEYTKDFEIEMGENENEVTKKVFNDNIIWYSEEDLKYTIKEHPQVKEYQEGTSPEFKCVGEEYEKNGTIHRNVYEGDKVQGGEEFIIGKPEKFINDLTNPLQGQLVLTKQIEGDGVSNNDDFEFSITVIEKGDETTKKTEKVSIKANETWTSNLYEWGPNEKAPKFTIEEKLPGDADGWEFVKVESNNVASEEIDGNKITVVLNGKTQEQVTDSGNVELGNVLYTNKYKEHNATFKLTKKVFYPDKILSINGQKFVFDVTISGEFKIQGEEGLKTSYTFRKEIDFTNSNGMGGSLKTGTASITYDKKIFWYGNNAPTVHVTEIPLREGDSAYYNKLSKEQKDIADAWELVSISNNDEALVYGEGKELEIIASNRIDSIPIPKFVIKFAGNVWEDEFPNPENKDDDAMPDGIYNNDKEKGLEGVEVYIYNNDSRENVIDIYDNPIEQPIVTDVDGYWETPEIKLKPGGDFARDYHVEFVYDGQTYEPTAFLATGSAADYMGGTTAKRDTYAKDSMALDINRQEVNNKLTEIQGKTARSGTGETIGEAIGEKTYELYYKDLPVTNNKKVSVLQTTYNKTQTGRKAVYDVFKATASTSNDSGDLRYPFDNKTTLSHTDMQIVGSSLEIAGTYKATYNYCLHINLGLRKRRESDLSVSKDLLSAKVIINEQLQEKNFNSLDDIIRKAEGKNYAYDLSEKNRKEFKLGLYNTDYYYRAEMYKSDYQAYDAITKLYADLGTGETISDKDLEVYLNYVITIRNDSSTKYKAKVYEINDYFDSSFGSPIDAEVWKTINDGTERKNTLIANPSYYQINGELITDANGVIQDESRIIKDWDIKERNVNSSDGLTYNKMSTSSIKDVAIESGEFIDIYVSFKVSKAKYNEVYESLMLGNKSNIAEISKYSIYNKNTNAIEGKIDKDSAPDNINMALNYYDSYEDDTDSSPVLKLYLEEDVREISGKAWEDRKTNNVGEIENDEALIGGLTTQLVQKITYNDINYDFVWPTDEPLDILGGKRLKDLTGFDSTIETAREKEGTQEVGSYKFKGIPSGKYAVRFIYGDNKINPAEALNSEGENFYMKNGGEENKILTANYNKYLLGNTPAVYNGQDYKTTIYQKGKGTLNNRELGLELNEGVVKLTEDVSSLSSARDSEARRLQVMAESETIMNTIGEILATANERYADHTKLYEKTNMFADTAILDFTGLESLQTKGAQKDKSTRAEIAGLNIGLIERPENAIVLDKEIKDIKIVTNDGKIIFDAQYDVNYKVESSIDESKVVLGKVDGGYLVADVKLSNQSINTEVLQSINKAEQKLNDAENNGLQNFRYINVDSDILQGATIEIDYVMTAINIGENDYINKDLATVFTNGDSISSEMLKLAKAKAEKEAKADGSLDFGENIGNFYYTGNKGANDEIVTTRIRQLIDYVDSDAVFLQEKNNSENHKWRGTSSTELQGNGKKASILIGNSAIPLITVLDKNSIEYITKSSNNVVLSGDSTGDYNKDTTENINAGFQASLKPYDSLEGDKDKLPEENESMAQIELTVSKVISAQEDTNNLEFDNLAEIVKYENSAGRRDVVTIPGNASPKGSVEVVGAKKVVNEGEFAGALLERDTSATEVITFTPPTGQEVQIVLATEVLIMALISLTLIVIGIVIIKNRVIKRTV